MGLPATSSTKTKDTHSAPEKATEKQTSGRVPAKSQTPAEKEQARSDTITGIKDLQDAMDKPH